MLSFHPWSSLLSTRRPRTPVRPPAREGDDHSRRGRAGAVVLAALLPAGLLAGCSEVSLGGSGGTGSGATGSSAAQVEPVEVRANVRRGATGVAVDTVLRLEASHGRLADVVVRAGDQRVPGRLSDDGTRWRATGRLEPGLQYAVRAATVRSDGERAAYRQSFRTADLTLDDQTYASIAPLDGETVGVGMPVVVTFDVPVTDKASIERHLAVQSTPAQQGAWHWLSDTEVHWRPKSYWRPGTEVVVDADVNSVPAGGGVYGQESRRVSFTVGDAVVHRVDVDRHVMESYVNGELARTIPVSAGKPGFETRSGTKVIIEKFRSKRMDAATTGISPGDPEYYNIADVEYALRVTYSGEFLHAAPWSVGSQGDANVSHGCVGMSTEDARWVYERTNRGDVVEVTGTDRQMTLENGFGDWNVPFADYEQGSALT